MEESASLKKQQSNSEVGQRRVLSKESQWVVLLRMSSWCGPPLCRSSNCVPLFGSVLAYASVRKPCPKGQHMIESEVSVRTSTLPVHSRSIKTHHSAMSYSWKTR